MKRLLLTALVAFVAIGLTTSTAVAKKKGPSPQGMAKCIAKIIECGAPHNTAKAKTYKKCIKKLSKVDSVCGQMQKGITACLKKKKCGKKGPKAPFCRLGCNFGGSAKKAFQRAAKCTKKCIKGKKGPKCLPRCFAGIKGIKFPKAGKGGTNQGGSKKGMIKCAQTVVRCGAPDMTPDRKKYLGCVSKLAKIDKVCAGLGKAIKGCLKNKQCAKKKGPKAAFCRLGCNFAGAAKKVFERGLKCATACIKAGKPPTCVPKCFAGINKKGKK